MALARYLRASQAYPSTVQLATGAFVMAVGDASTQLAVEGGQTLDPNRIGCAAFFNGAISPVLHYWYQFLDRKFPGVSVRALAPKLIANQMVSSPIAVNFALVPSHLRIAFMSTVACGWGGFLSFMAHRTIK